MYLRLCSLGVLVLAGCTGTAPEAPQATAPTPTEAATKDTVAGRSYTISVPNMT